jgi:hypothetical protein
MNCQELQRHLLTTPMGRHEASVSRHITRCARCRRFAKDLARFERVIEAAALSIEAPEGLVARVLLRDQKPRGEEPSPHRASPDDDGQIRFETGG